MFRWKSSRTCRSPAGLHGGITLASRVFLGSQHYIVSNSYKLVRAPRRLRSPCPSPYGSVPTLRSISSQVPMGPTRDVTCNAMPATFAEASTQLPLAEFFLGCIYTNDPLDRSFPPPTHGNASSASLLQPTDIATIYSPSSRTSGRSAPRARHHSTPPPPPGLEGQASLSSPHGIPVEAAPVRPRLHTFTSPPSLQPHVSTTLVGSHPVRSAPTY